LEESVGHVCGEYIYIYPPGVPLIVPGEVITNEIIQEIRKAIKLGLNIKGLVKKGKEHNQIPIVKEKHWLNIMRR